MQKIRGHNKKAPHKNRLTLHSKKELIKKGYTNDMEYNFREIEKKWREYWIANKVYKVEMNEKPKYYVLDMFPYPSGAGLHVGHPLGYIASDIYSRYKLSLIHI